MMKNCWLYALAASLLLFQQRVTAQECAADGTCDKHERCPVWREEGECYRNEVCSRPRIPFCVFGGWRTMP
jgi:hypothetical protein